ncbi:MAG: hypothetical protein RIR26_187 [Pseudomonadota bacterium]|jgi:hypothetical protein
MDLMKLLKSKSDHLVARASSAENAAEKIFADLKIQLDSFLKDVSKLDEFKKNNPLDGIKCLTGELLLEDEFGALDKTPYLFLRLPGKPGLLLEPQEPDSLSLCIATEARPIQRHWNGDVSSQTVFVRRKTPLASYTILDADTVRDSSTGQTHLGSKFFESLVEKLILHLTQEKA